MSWVPYLCITCTRHPDVKMCYDDSKCIHFVGTRNEAGQPVLHADPDDTLPFGADTAEERKALA